MRSRLFAGALLLAALTTPAAAQEDYPQRKPITLVTPYAAGGGSDILTRILGEALRKNLDQQVVVMNTPGSGGVIGSRSVAQAAPDGYTLLSHHVGLVTSPALYKNLGFDPVKSFAPVGLFADTPMVLVGGNHVPAKDAQELLAWVRKTGDKVTFASSGSGSATHLCAMLFEKAVGQKVTMIQYRGAAPATIDVTAGRVDLFCDVTAGSIIQTIQSGSLRPYFITAAKRLASLPDVPTSTEIRLPDVNVTAWYGLYAPAGTPQPVVDKLSRALQAATRDPGVAAALAKMETTVFDPSLATPQALQERVSSQVDLWTPILQKAGVVPQ
jgi:tripartite-type tricarboxylate transporter receptor subunit TctC